MCIVSNRVEKMAKTKILVARNNKRQLVVYENKVTNRIANNAMILPVPNPGTLRFDNLKNYPNVFKDCAKSFADMDALLTNSRTLSFGTRCSKSKSIAVFSVGSYNVSVLSNFEDFSRLNKDFFDIDEDCLRTLEDYKTLPFGFIICQLKTGDHTYHPLAYSHDIINNQIFIPTKHYHGEYNERIVDDWDHDIYLYNIDSSKLPGKFNFNLRRFSWSGEDEIKKDQFDFDFGPVKKFTKFNVSGRNINNDIIIDDR